MDFLIYGYAAFGAMFIVVGAAWAMKDLFLEKLQPGDKLGDFKIVSKFLWFPKRLPTGDRYGPDQIKWLCRAKIAKMVFGYTFIGEPCNPFAWGDFYWVEDSDSTGKAVQNEK